MSTNEKMREALEAIETVLEDAYHRHFAECCGRGNGDCCGDFVEQWTPEDHKILDTLSPIQRSLQEALAEPAEPEAQEPVSWQGGLSNKQLIACWKSKLPKREPTADELSAFALGVEVGTNIEPIKKGHYIIRHNNDGEFGRQTGWLYRDGGDLCAVSGQPVYVWKPLSELIGTSTHPTPEAVRKLVEAAERVKDCALRYKLEESDACVEDLNEALDAIRNGK